MHACALASQAVLMGVTGGQAAAPAASGRPSAACGDTVGAAALGDTGCCAVGLAGEAAPRDSALTRMKEVAFFLRMLGEQT